MHTPRTIFLSLILALYVLSARAEKLMYEVYELDKSGIRTLLANGTRDYSVRDIVVREATGDTGPHWSKELAVVNGFAIGASIYRRKRITGFGLWLVKTEGLAAHLAGGGSSWEWFARESDSVYKKLRGSGLVKATFVRSNEYEELASLEFLEDVILRVKAKPSYFFDDRETHHLVIVKGSVLRFAP
jgi:hypothetical protein